MDLVRISKIDSKTGEETLLVEENGTRAAAIAEKLIERSKDVQLEKDFYDFMSELRKLKNSEGEDI